MYGKSQLFRFIHPASVYMRTGFSQTMLNTVDYYIKYEKKSYFANHFFTGLTLWRDNHRRDRHRRKGSVVCFRHFPRIFKISSIIAFKEILRLRPQF